MYRNTPTWNYLNHTYSALLGFLPSFIWYQHFGKQCLSFFNKEEKSHSHFKQYNTITTTVTWHEFSKGNKQQNKILSTFISNTATPSKSNMKTNVGELSVVDCTLLSATHAWIISLSLQFDKEKMASHTFALQWHLKRIMIYTSFSIFSSILGFSGSFSIIGCHSKREKKKMLFSSYESLHSLYLLSLSTYDRYF